LNILNIHRPFWSKKRDTGAEDTAILPLSQQKQRDKLARAQATGHVKSKPVAAGISRFPKTSYKEETK